MLELTLSTDAEPTKVRFYLEERDASGTNETRHWAANISRTAMIALRFLSIRISLCSLPIPFLCTHISFFICTLSM